MHTTVAICGVHAGKKFNTQNKECMNVGISIILPLYLPVHHVQQKYADSNRKKLSGNKFPNLSCGVAAVGTSFYRIH
jgi:hypothetical protein